MKTKNSIFLLLVVVYPYVSSAIDTLSVGDALHNNKIKMNISSNGGHMGYCIKADVVNSSSKPILLRFERGREFKSQNPDVQDIIIVKEELMALEPGAKGSKELYGFCTQSSNSCPTTADKFTLGNVATGDMAQLVE